MKPMKRTPAIIAVILVLVSVMTISVFADSQMDSAGRYGKIRGSSIQNDSNLVLLKTSVNSNRDNAFLTHTIDFYCQNGVCQHKYDTSSRGVTSFSAQYPINRSIDAIPHAAYCAHGIQGGNTVDGKAYVTYTSTPIT